MKKSTKKPATTAAPSKLSPTDAKFDAFLALWTTYLHLRAWGLPEYEKLTPEDKEYFRGLVAKGDDVLFAHAENCKLAVLRAGLGDQVRDEWLGFVGLSDFDLAKGLPQANRDKLGKMLEDMWPLLVRLDPDAAPPLVIRVAAEPIPDDLLTTEVAIIEFYASRATIRRKVKAGELHDYRKPGSPSNTKLLLSRAELGCLFARRRS